MKKTLPYIALFGLEFLTLKSWALCKNLQDSLFHFSKSQYELKIIEATTGKIDNSIFTIRFFHNKIALFFIEAFNLLIRFWDPFLMVNLISLMGAFFTLTGIYSLLQKRKYRILIGLFMFLFIANSIEIVLDPKVNFLIKVLVLTFPYISFSYFGINHYLETRRSSWQKTVFLILLFGMSLLWLVVFQRNPLLYCVK